MKPVMQQQIWPGWIGTLPANDNKYRLTWVEWRAWQGNQFLRPQRWHARNASRSPRPGDVAARAFLAWFDAWFDTGASDRPSSVCDDRELAVRRFMRSFEAVATALD